MTQMQPIFILPEGTQRSSGKNAQRNNIAAAQALAETVRTTLGPKGMDKLLVDNLGDVIVTNDGVTILKEIGVEHPAAKMIVEVAKTQEAEVGDGTTTAVVISGELLKKAEDLLDQEIHPSLITKGYRMAAEKAQEVLKTMGEPITPDDKELLIKIAETAMTGKGAEHAKSKLALLAVEAVTYVMDKSNRLNRDFVKIEKKTGGSVEDSELVKGIILDKEKVHARMPDTVSGAKIALIDAPLEVKGPETDAKIQITDPGQLQGFLDAEEKMLVQKVDAVAKSGANVLFCQKGIDDIAQHFLAKKNIFAVRRVSKSDMENLARATGAKVVSNLQDLSQEDLGAAGVVEAARVGDDDMVYVKECLNPKAVTVLIRGASEHVIDEIKRAMEDAIGDVGATLNVGRAVPGAGAVEIELAKELRKYANSLSGREQLAVNSFADSVEIIPRTLAENSGMDPIDIMTELKAAHDNGDKNAGVNVFTGKIMDSWKEGVIEPLKIKTQAISSASEVATMILRIDDVIASSGGGGSPGPQGMPPGMEGMGGGMPY